jgi:hypothetical protein
VKRAGNSCSPVRGSFLDVAMSIFVVFLVAARGMLFSCEMSSRVDVFDITRLERREGLLGSCLRRTGLQFHTAARELATPNCREACRLHDVESNMIRSTDIARGGLITCCEVWLFGLVGAQRLSRR